MEPQERDLIVTLLDRIKAAAGQPKDFEADALIRRAVAQQPDAPYYLVQIVLIQQLSLQQTQDRINDLEQQVATVRPSQSSSFLGDSIGRGSPAPSGPGVR